MKRRSQIFVGVLLAAFVLLIAWPAPPPVSHVYFDRSPKSSVEIIAHGGGLGHAPPNTILALERAGQMGADIFEADVQQTRDGVLILRHDDTLDRTTNMSGLIADYDWQGLSSADAGAKTEIQGETYANRGVRIPRLDAALMAFPNAYWILEIKNDTDAAAIEMCQTIKASGASERVLVGSFHDAAMTRFRTECPAVATSMASNEVRNFVIAARVGLSRFVRTPAVAMQIPLAAEGIDLTHPRVIDAAKARGIKLHYWTINDPSDLSHLIEIGADGLITDYVDRGRHAIVKR